MRYLREISLVVFTALIFITSCNNKIEIGPDNLTLTDIVNNKIELYGASKDTVVKYLEEFDLLEDSSTWFYIDRDFYSKYTEIQLDSNWIDVKRESVTILFFSTSENSKELFLEYYRENDIRYYNLVLNLEIIIDEASYKVLDIIVEF